jgi:hypothetical protein
MAEPIDHGSRLYLAFLRGPVGPFTFCFGTQDEYRGGYQHYGQLAAVPEPADNALNDFGIQDRGGFTVEIADEPTDAGAADWYLLQEDGSRLLQEDLNRFAIEY